MALPLPVLLRLFMFLFLSLLLPVSFILPFCLSYRHFIGIQSLLVKGPFPVPHVLKRFEHDFHVLTEDSLVQSSGDLGESGVLPLDVQACHELPKGRLSQQVKVLFGGGNQGEVREASLQVFHVFGVAVEQHVFSVFLELDEAFLYLNDVLQVLLEFLLVHALPVPQLG